MWVIYNQYGTVQKVVNNTDSGRVSVVNDFVLNAYFLDLGNSYTATITIRRPDDSILVELLMTASTEVFTPRQGDTSYSPLISGESYPVYKYAPENNTVFNVPGIYHATVRIYDGTTQKVAGRFDFYVEDAVVAETTNIPVDQLNTIISGIGSKITTKSNLAVKHIANIANLLTVVNTDDYIAGDVVYCDTNKEFYTISGTGLGRTYARVILDRAKKDKDGNQIDTTYLKRDGSLPMTGDLNMNGNKIMLDDVEITGDEDWLDIKGHAIPDDTNTYNLGATLYKWKNLWLSGELKDGTNSVTIADIVSKQGGNIIGIQNGENNFSGGVPKSYSMNGQTRVPQTPSQPEDLTTKKYVDDNFLPLEGGDMEQDAWIGVDEITTIAGKNIARRVTRGFNTSILLGDDELYSIIANNRFIPNDVDYDLGENSLKKWRNLYLSGSLKDGANSISIADIVNKSTVSVSASGTSTNEVNYITINGVERRLAGGSGNVDDVKVNNVSVVTNKVANIDLTPYDTAFNDASYSQSGDNVNIVLTRKNTQTKSVNLPLADSSNPGLMSSSDVTAISSLTTRVEALEGQTIRLLYTASQNPSAAQILAFVQSKGYTDPTKYAGIAVVVNNTNHIWKWVNNAKVSGTWIWKNTLPSISGISNLSGASFTSNNETYSIVTLQLLGDVFKVIYAKTAQLYDVVFENGAWNNDAYKTMNYGSTDKNVNTSFLTYLIANTDTQGTYSYGYFQDFGLDTVNTFTNSIAGIIKGSQTDGKVYAENDGTGSVYGWDTLKNRVTTVETGLTNYLPLSGGTMTGLIQTGTGSNKGIVIGLSGSNYKVYTPSSGTGIYVKSYNDTDILSLDVNAINPRVQMDLGSVGFKWKDIYLTGTLHDETNSITIAQIATKTYAESLIHITAEDFIIQ